MLPCCDVAYTIADEIQIFACKQETWLLITISIHLQSKLLETHNKRIKHLKTETIRLNLRMYLH